ncbi:MAG: hypothetical protein AB7O97_10385 [Planctomycetota bacterium]
MDIAHRLFALLALAALALPQSGKDDDEVAKTPVDPYTEGDLTALVAAGLVAYGPFQWTAHARTEDIDRVLGEGRVLWLETEHFKIGCNLRTIGLPKKPDEKKALMAECKALHDKLPKVPERPKKLDPWLRLHLFAQRAEAVYAQYEEMLGPEGTTFPGGATPPNGQYLGLPGKFLLLLFQKKSDLARYFDRFAGGIQADRSYGHYHLEGYQMLYGVSAEGLEIDDDPGLHSHVVYGIAGNIAVGYRGYTWRLPPWLSEGLAHWFSRQIETNYVNITVKDEDNVDDKEQHKWHKKVRARAKYDRTVVPFSRMLEWKAVEDMGYHDHLQAWSRVDFLMQQGHDKVGALLRRLKGLTAPSGGMPQDVLIGTQTEVLEEVFDMDPETFDARWREWVEDTYPRK